MPHFEVLFLSIELILNILPKVIEVKLKGGDESVNPCSPTEAKRSVVPCDNYLVTSPRDIPWRARSTRAINRKGQLSNCDKINSSTYKAEWMPKWFTTSLCRTLSWGKNSEIVAQNFTLRRVCRKFWLRQRAWKISRTTLLQQPYDS